MEVLSGVDKIHNLYPKFADSVKHVLIDLRIFCRAHYPEYTPYIIEGFRTASYQNKLWRKGRLTPPIGKKFTVTDRDGYVRRSNHQSSLAVDIVFRHGKESPYDAPKELWEHYGHLCRLYGLKWGGDWKSRIDKPHCEWDESDSTTYALAKKWQQESGLR